MTFRFSDRCKVTTAAPNTGAIPAAAAAVTGFIQISAIPSIANGDIVPYTITDGGANWECGYGTWNNSTGLARTTVKTSSNSGSTVNFANAVTVFCGAIAASLALLDNNGKLTLPGSLSLGGVTLTGVGGPSTLIQGCNSLAQSVAPLATSATFALPGGGGIFCLSESGSFGSGCRIYAYHNQGGTVGILLLGEAQSSGSTNINSVQAVSGGFTVSNGNTTGNTSYNAQVISGN